MLHHYPCEGKELLQCSTARTKNLIAPPESEVRLKGIDEKVSSGFRHYHSTETALLGVLMTYF